MKDPVFFTFGLHAHQPVGNFDHVFEEHLKNVYLPFLNRAIEGELFPLTLHLSGPLLDWLEANSSDYLDLVGALVADGKVELLLAGYFEPILPSLLREDRIDQVRWMQEALRSRFGVEARGLWLTERVWEPDLAADLVDAGAEYVLVDDRHFVAAGFSKEQLHQPFRTEAGGKSLGVFAIDEQLRYFLPFHPPEDTVSYLRRLRSDGKHLAVAADDIEKFGGWPGTREWVYDRGWLEKFIQAIKHLEAAGEVKLSTFSQALAELPSGGVAYLPSSSYREMEEWALPVEAFRRMERLKEFLGDEAYYQGDSPLIRGSHWRNFLVKYSESNRMHKKGMALSRLCRERGDPADVRRALGASQCNDAYWHGVFGGLYLRHLRDTVWWKLAEAEGRLRTGERLSFEQVDLDLDGNEELWVHSDAFSALVSPARGGAVEEFTFFDAGVNLANTLTRRREAYHRTSADPDTHLVEGSAQRPTADSAPAPSIHDLEAAVGFADPPPVDLEDRAIFQDRVLPAHLELEAYQAGRFNPIHSWTGTGMKVLSLAKGTGEEEGGEDEACPGWVEVALGDSEKGRFEKRFRFEAEGALEVTYEWDPNQFPQDAVFTSELSLGGEANVLPTPAATLWRFPVSTFSKSERGVDETVQGESLTVRWPVSIGRGRIRLTLKEP